MMKLKTFRLFSSIHLLCNAVLAQPLSPRCKESHLSDGWPSHDTWAQFNATIAGNLLAPLPPAVVCDPGEAQYNQTSCAAVDSVWFTAAFIDEDPVSLHQPNWQDDACVPPSAFNGSDPCDVEPFAKYVANASTAEHVVEAVKFASKHNLRLSVMNTGHDYLGRSTSPGFQLWTHYLKRLELHPDFKATSCSSCSGIPAMTIGAGSQYGEIYNFSAEHDVVINGGEEPSVGFGGHLTGGGHSPLGSLYGLLVDNVLEVQIVTPTGELIRANECQHSDLFWATKGGGGSTFGVLVAATVRTYNNQPAVSFALTFESTEEEATQNYNSNFYSVLADMYADLVQWSDNYINGYFTIGPAWQLAAIEGGAIEPPTANSYSYYMSFLGYGLNQSAVDLKRTMSAFTQLLNTTNGIEGSLEVEQVPRTIDLLRKSNEGLSSTNAYIGSRLWDRGAMENKTGLIDIFRSLEPNLIMGLAVTGPALRDESLIASTSVTPTWRTAYLHTTCGTSWPHRNATAEAVARTTASSVRDILAGHALHMGAYLNEADRDQPNPGQTFWGDNYERLLDIKRRYDPRGTFWCKPCIGFEDWVMDENTGQLCHV